MDTTLCDLSNPPSSTSQSHWDLMFEQSLEALCASLNVLGNIDSSIMRNYTRKKRDDTSPDTDGNNKPGCHGDSLRSSRGRRTESANIDSSGYLSSDSSSDTLVASQNSGNSVYPYSTAPISGYGCHINKDSARENGWTSALLSPGNKGGDVVHHTPRFVRDTSKFWYKPHISREEAINMLKNKPPGTFVVRDSNSFPGAFGLALKVSQVPPNVQTKGGDPQAELVRHFLIEPTPKGVKLKGCSNEPVFGSLAALVYQHSITPLALPCKLVLPESASDAEYSVVFGEDPAVGDQVDGKKEHVSSSSIMQQGAACNVLYINSVDMESLTGREAVSKAVKDSIGIEPAKCTVVHFKVSSQGITLTDNKRKLFFRRHYPIITVTYCGLDPEDRRWTKKYEDQPVPQNARLFGFVARKQGSATDNACHIFAELDPDQPAHAIVSFVSKVMAGQGHFMKS